MEKYKINKFLKILSVTYMTGFFLILLLPAYISPNTCYNTPEINSISYNGELLNNNNSTCLIISEEEMNTKQQDYKRINIIISSGILGWGSSMYFAKRKEERL